MYMLTRHEAAAERQRMLLLMTEYPAAAGVLWGFWGAGICAGTLWDVVLGYLDRKKRARTGDNIWKLLVTYVLIEIEDEGIGIRKEELQKIYQRFYRGEDAARMAEEGAGVGLYLARVILERQGGTIFAAQRKGKGTVFRVTLPCSQ